MNISTTCVATFDRLSECKAFDDTKAGVKGVIDAANGMVEIPKIFIRPPEELAEDMSRGQINLQVPAIDLSGAKFGSNRRKKIVDEIKYASENWGFFTVVNHGIPMSVLDQMLDGVRKFHELDQEIKKQFYTREKTKKVRFNSNYDLYKSRAANWRDTLSISLLLSEDLDPNEVPEICRDAALEYMEHIRIFGESLFELLSEALGLKVDHLTELDCHKGRTFVCHYYPECPEPDLTMGIGTHTDSAFLTILVQDQIGGLQFLHEDQWADVEPIPGGLAVNIGDILQIVSNDRFKSVVHRVPANRVGPRVSVACFFAGIYTPPKIYGPIKELISEETPRVYKDLTVSDFIAKFYSRSLDSKNGLEPFRL